MARRHWTVLVLSEDDTRVRQFRLSRELLRTTIGLSLLALALAGSLGAGLVGHNLHDHQIRKLSHENALLRSEVAKIQQRSAQLDDVMNQLAQQDRAYRLVAGLDPLSDDVLEAGVGGPGTETLSDDPLFHLDPPVGTTTFRTSDDIETLIRRAHLLSTSWTEAAQALKSEHAKLESTPSIAPVHGWLTSPFSRSRMHPILNIARPHEGIDIAAPVGTPIEAAADGVVSFAGRHHDFGLMVEIDHGHGYTTRYAHASRLLVKAGQHVKRGEKIAEVGETGLAIGPHLHYEVLVNGRHRNPRDFILMGNAIPE